MLFSINYKLPCSHILFAVDKVTGTLPIYSLWWTDSESTANGRLPANVGPAVTVTVASVGPKSAKAVVGDLHLILSSLSTTIQGFPIPVMRGYVNWLRSLNDRLRANESTNLILNGELSKILVTNFLFQLSYEYR